MIGEKERDTAWGGGEGSGEESPWRSNKHEGLSSCYVASPGCLSPGHPLKPRA